MGATSSCRVRGRVHAWQKALEWDARHTDRQTHTHTHDPSLYYYPSVLWWLCARKPGRSLVCKKPSFKTIILKSAFLGDQGYPGVTVGWGVYVSVLICLAICCQWIFVKFLGWAELGRGTNQLHLGQTCKEDFICSGYCLNDQCIITNVLNYGNRSLVTHLGCKVKVKAE